MLRRFVMDRNVAALATGACGHEPSFNPTTPARIKPRQPSRNSVAGSPSMAIPHAIPPTAPMPVHTAYTVPMGSVRSDCDMQNKLSAITAATDRLGQSRVKPSDCFISTTQPISARPATASHNHATPAAPPPLRPRQAAFFASNPCAIIASAICTAFSAAPLRRLSDTHQNASPFSTVGSLRRRLT